MIWIGIAIGIAIGVLGYIAYDKYASKAETVLKTEFNQAINNLHARIAALEKRLGV